MSVRSAPMAVIPPISVGSQQRTVLGTPLGQLWRGQPTSGASATLEGLFLTLAGTSSQRLGFGQAFPNMARNFLTVLAMS